MKRKLLLFAGVLILMLVVKYAAAQDDGQVGWDLSEDSYLSGSINDDLAGFMLLAPFAGAGCGLIRILTRRSARPLLELLRLN